MNYLGHAYFSTEYSLLGNMAGDSLKGISLQSLDPQILKGIELHRLIDRLTDRQVEFGRIREIFAAAGIRYPGVLTDIVIDYALASRWEELSACPWGEFKELIYALLSREKERMPGSFRFGAYYLVHEDWFETYRSLEGLELAFFRLSRRTKRGFSIHRAHALVTERREFVQEQGTRIFELLFRDQGINRDRSSMLSRPRITPTAP